MGKYYFIKNDRLKDPLLLDEIIELNLSENTLVWKNGMKDWVQIKDLSDHKKIDSSPTSSKK